VTLPVKTTIEDVQQIVGYLRTKPTGATLEEAKAILTSKPLDGRKLKAYQAWGVINSMAIGFRLPTPVGR
jgi:hypothetical protein